MNYYKENAKRFPVKRVNKPSRHTTREFYLEGDPHFVILEVAKELNADSTTEMYEHMRLQVINVEYIELPGTPTVMRVHMFRSLYAGD